MQQPVPIETETLWTPYRTGARPVRRARGEDGRVRWELPSATDGAPAFVTTSNTELMVALTGHAQGRHWSPDRFFHLGDHAPKSLRGAPSTLFDLFPPAPSDQPAVAPLVRSSETFGLRVVTPARSFRPKFPEPASETLVGNSARSLVSTGPIFDILPMGWVPIGAPRVVRSDGRLGIDLAKRGHEVAKLMYAGFGRRIFASGYDPEDVLQEVYRGILARNLGKCPFDPSKSSFGHYVHMVIGCVLSNYHRQQHRRAEFEQVGIPGWSDGERSDRDAASLASKLLSVDGRDEIEGAVLQAEAEDRLVSWILESAHGDQAQLAIRALPLVREGWPRQAIAERLGVSLPTLSRAISLLRTQAREWFAAENEEDCALL